MMCELLFIPDDLVARRETQDIRTKELKQAEIRSHAPRVSHAKKKNEAQISTNTKAFSYGEFTDDTRTRTWKRTQTQSIYRHESRGEQEGSGDHQVAKYASAVHRQSKPREIYSEFDQLSVLFWQVSARSTGSFTKLLRIKNITTKDLLYFMSDEAMFHVGAAIFKYEHDILINPGKVSRKSLEHKSKALSIIRSRIRDPARVDNVTILAILLLPCCERARDSTEAYKTHWTAAARLIAGRNSTKAIEDSPGGTYISAIIDMSAPYYQMLTGHPMPAAELHPIQCTTRAPSSRFQLYNLPVGFRTLYEQCKIGRSTIALVENLFETLKDEPSETRLDEKTSSSFQQAWGAMNPYTSTIPNEASIEGIAQYALAFYTIRPLGPVGITGFLPRSYHNVLTRRLSGCLVERTFDEEAVLYWAWTVLVDSYKTRFGDLPAEGLTLRDKQAQRFPCWSVNAEESEQVLKMFPWNEDFLRYHHYFMLPVRMAAEV